MKKSIYRGLWGGLLWGCGQIACLAASPADASADGGTTASVSALMRLGTELRSSAAALEASVVQVSLVGYSRSSSSSSTTTTLNGVVVSDSGFVVVAGMYKAEQVEQVEIRIGKREVVGQIVGQDDLLGMSLIQIDPVPGMQSVLSLPLSELRSGDFAVLMEAGREDWDYQPMLEVALCRGAIPGNYQKYLLNELSSRFKGSPVGTLDGKFAGLYQSSGEVLAVTDIRDDLLEMMRKAEAGESQDEEENAKKGWLGATFIALNEDYARLKSLPEHGVFVAYVDESGPAWEAGLRTGDLVIGVHGKPLRFSGGRAMDLFLHMLRPKEEKPFALKVLRGETEEMVNGTFGKSPEPETLQADDLGISVSDIDSMDVVSQNLFTSEGVRVTVVKSGGPAAISGSMRKTLLIRNDVITAIGGIPTPDIAAFNQALQQIRQRGDRVLLVEYWRGRATGFAGLNLGIGEN